MTFSNIQLARIREGEHLNRKEQMKLLLSLSWPAILAQLSVTVMQLLDAGMAGRLGAAASASIGLVSSSTWLVHGLSSGAVFGFSVQTSQAIGSSSFPEARNLCRQGLICVLTIGLLIGSFGAVLADSVPVWLNGEAEVLSDAAAYFRIFCLSLPFVVLNSWAVQMLQGAGNTKLPGLLQIVMCVLDVIFNLFFIFGCRLGVAGAALGTALAEVISSSILTFWIFCKDPILKGRTRVCFTRHSILRAMQIGIPVSAEQFIMSSAYVTFTRIVSGLGSMAVAANSFAITAESLCYMPGYGISAAATGVIGQCVGAGNEKMGRQIGWRAVGLGAALMTVSGVVMFAGANLLMQILTPVTEIQQMGASCLRMEAFAEPMYGASIVVTGVLRGKGDTLGPTILSFISMWCIRIPLAVFFTRSMGLVGAWLAMLIELNFRGLVFMLWFKLRWKLPEHLVSI